MFEAVGAFASGGIDEEELGEIERHACPTEGSCAGMFTANTMASVAEALGMSLPGSASPPAVDRRRDDFAYESGQAVIELLRRNIRPRQIMTKEAFENAIAVVMALGGSTNAVLHLLAIAHEARVDLELDDFNRVAAKVPHIADTKPHGNYHMSDVDRIGGVPVVMARAARGRPDPRRLPDGHRPDRGREPGRDRLRPPRTATSCTPSATRSTTGGGIAVLTGSLAPKGSVVKVAGIDVDRFEGPARVFDGEAAAMEEILAGAASTPATSWSSATRAPRVGPACGRCWPSPAP